MEEGNGNEGLELYILVVVAVVAEGKVGVMML
jgi:hypothetical protein